MFCFEDLLCGCDGVVDRIVVNIVVSLYRFWLCTIIHVVVIVVDVAVNIIIHTRIILPLSLVLFLIIHQIN